MAKKAKKKTTGASTWRNIQQSFTGRAVTTHARKRRWLLNLKFLGGFAAVALLGAAIWAGLNYLRSDSFERLMAGGSAPVRSVQLITDGVLDEAWLNERVALPVGIELMAVDIETIRHDVTGDGQVKSAQVERVFPDTLRIRVTERQPVLRLALQDASGNKYLRLLARDGHVFAGKRYPLDTLRSLPFVQGVTLRRKVDGSYEPVRGIEGVAVFLTQARRLVPEQFVEWKTISLRNYDPFGEAVSSRFTVTTNNGCEIIFAPEGTDAQLARLDVILTRLEAERRRIDRIDLSMDDAVVKLADAGVRGPSRFR